jgi:predicted anti-sigma-YlaC factor YlaD
MGMISNIKQILTMNCEQAARLLSNQQDAELTRSERWALKLHLLICRSCRRYQGQLGFMRKLFGILGGKGDTVPPELRISEDKRDEINKTLRKKEGS